MAARDERAATARHYERQSVILSERMLNRSEQYYRDLAQEYNIALNRIQKEIESFHYRFSEDNQLSLADTQRILTTDERNRFRMDINEYIRRGQEMDPAWDLRLQNASTLHRITRLEALQMQTQQQVEELFARHHTGTADLLRNIYTDGFNINAAELNPNTFATIDTRRVELLMTKPWLEDGKNFSERIWGDRTELVNFLNREMTQSFIRGEGPDRLIKELKQKFGVSSYQAARLVQTETAYFNTMAKRDSYIQMGFKKYTNLAVMDAKTSDVCMEMDREVFYITDLKVGVNAPPFHPHCRTTIAPYADRGTGERGRGMAMNPDTGQLEQVVRDNAPMLNNAANNGIIDDMNKRRYVNNLSKILETATPNVGTIHYRVTPNRAELRAIEWLHNNLGGDITVLQPSAVEGQKTPDLLWRGMPLEIKHSLASINAMDKSIQQGLRQTNQGGVLVDISGSLFSDEDAISKAMNRLFRRNRLGGYVIIIRDNNLVGYISDQ